MQYKIQNAYHHHRENVTVRCCNIVFQCEYDCGSKVKYSRTPILSGHPRGSGKWLLNRGWPLNRGSSEISIMRGINVTLFEYNTVGGLLNIIQPVFRL